MKYVDEYRSAQLALNITQEIRRIQTRPWVIMEVCGGQTHSIVKHGGIMDPERTRGFPISAGIFFGLGIGGFFDGIILHQVLQWHHMLTSDGYPLTSLHNLEVNTLWDELFHITTYIFVLIGLIILWKNAHRTHGCGIGRCAGLDYGRDWHG